MSRALLLSLVLVLLAGIAHAAELQARFAAAATGDLLTWAITGAPVEWRSSDTTRTPQLRITDPRGTVSTRPAFATSDGLWVRHVARSPGRHEWSLLDPQGTAVASGELEVAAGTVRPGPIGISKRNPRFLAYPDGAPFIPVGPNVAWVAGDPVAGYEAEFAKLEANGCNHTRVWMSTWCLSIDGGPGKELRLDRADQLDGVLAAARRHGVRVTLVLDNHTDVLEGSPFTVEGGIGERQAAFFTVPPAPGWVRRLRYCVARWGADDALLAFELMNEADLAQPVRERSRPWVTAAAELLQRLDQDRRLHTLSWCGGDWEVALATPAIDIVHLHQYVLEFIGESEDIAGPTRDGVGMLLKHGARANAFGRPWLLAETGFQGTNASNRGNELDTAGLLLRQQLWAGFLLGGCGGGMTWWWDVYLDPNDLWKLYRPFAAITAKLDLDDPELAPITPNALGTVRLIGWASARQALLWPQLRNDTWYSYLVENHPRPTLPYDQPIRLGGFLPGRTYRVTPYDPRNGEAGEVLTLTASPEGKLEFTLRNGTRDVVWLVGLTAAAP